MLLFISLLFLIACYVNSQVIPDYSACAADAPNPAIIINSSELSTNYEIKIKFSVNPDCQIIAGFPLPVSAFLRYNNETTYVLNVVREQTSGQDFIATTIITDPEVQQELEALPFVEFIVLLNFVPTGAVSHKTLIALKASITCTDPKYIFSDYMITSSFNENSTTGEEKIDLTLVYTPLINSLIIEKVSFLYNNVLYPLVLDSSSQIDNSKVLNYKLTNLTSTELTSIKEEIIITGAIPVVIAIPDANVCIATTVEIKHTPIISSSNVCKLPDSCQNIQYSEVYYKESTIPAENPKICIKAIVPTICQQTLYSDNYPTSLSSFIHNPIAALVPNVLTILNIVTSETDQAGVTTTEYCGDLGEEMMKSLQASNSISLNLEVSCLINGTLSNDRYISGIIRKTPSSLDLLNFEEDTALCNNIREKNLNDTFSLNITFPADTSSENILNSIPLPMQIVIKTDSTIAAAADKYLILLELNGGVYSIQPIQSTDDWLVEIPNDIVETLIGNGIIDLTIVKKDTNTIVCKDNYYQINFASALANTNFNFVLNNCLSIETPISNIVYNETTPTLLLFDLSIPASCMESNIIEVIVDNEIIPAILVNKEILEHDLPSKYTYLVNFQPQQVPYLKETGILDVLLRDENSGIILKRISAALPIEMGYSDAELEVEIDPQVQPTCDLNAFVVNEAYFERFAKYEADENCGAYTLVIKVTAENACYLTNPKLVYYVNGIRNILTLHDYNIVPVDKYSIRTTRTYSQFVFSEETITELQFNQNLTGYLYSNNLLIKKDIPIIVDIYPSGKMLTIDPNLPETCYEKCDQTVYGFAGYKTKHTITACGAVHKADICDLDYNPGSAYQPNRLGIFDNNVLVFEVLNPYINNLSTKNCIDPVVFYVEIENQVFEAERIVKNGIFGCSIVSLLADSYLYKVQLPESAAQIVRSTNSIKYYGISNDIYVQFPEDEMCVERQPYKCFTATELALVAPATCAAYFETVIKEEENPIEELYLNEEGYLYGKYNFAPASEECESFEFIPIVHISNRIYNMTVTKAYPVTNNIYNVQEIKQGTVSVLLSEEDAEAVKNTETVTISLHYKLYNTLLAAEEESEFTIMYDHGALLNIPEITSCVLDVTIKTSQFLKTIPVIVKTDLPEIDDTLPEECSFNPEDIKLISAGINNKNVLTISFEYLCDCYVCPTDLEEEYPWTLYIDTNPRIELTSVLTKNLTDMYCGDNISSGFTFTTQLTEDIVEKLRLNPSIFINLVTCTHATTLYHYPLTLKIDPIEASYDNLVNPSCENYFENFDATLYLDLENCEENSTNLTLNAMILEVAANKCSDLFKCLSCSKTGGVLGLYTCTSENLIVSTYDCTSNIDTKFYFYLNGEKYILDPTEGYYPAKYGLTVLNFINHKLLGWFGFPELTSTENFFVRDCAYTPSEPAPTCNILENLFCTTDVLGLSSNSKICRECNESKTTYKCPSENDLFDLINRGEIRLFVEQNGKLIRDDIIIPVKFGRNYRNLTTYGLDTTTDPTANCDDKPCSVLGDQTYNLHLSNNNVLSLQLVVPKDDYLNYDVTFEIAGRVVTFVPTVEIETNNTSVKVGYVSYVSSEIATLIRNGKNGTLEVNSKSIYICKQIIEASFDPESPIADPDLPETCFDNAQNMYLQNLILSSDGTLSVEIVNADPNCGFNTNCKPYLTTVIGDQIVNLLYSQNSLSQYRTFKATNLTAEQIELLKNNLYRHFNYYTCNNVLQRDDLFEMIDLPIDKPSIGLSTIPSSAKLLNDSKLQVCFTADPLNGINTGSIVLTSVLGYVEHYFVKDTTVTNNTCYVTTLPLTQDTLSILKLGPTFIVWVYFIKETEGLPIVQNNPHLEAKVPFYIAIPDAQNGSFSFDDTCPSTNSFAIQFENDAQVCISKSSHVLKVSGSTDCTGFGPSVTLKTIIGNETISFKLTKRLTDGTYEFVSDPLSDTTYNLLLAHSFIGIYLYENDDLVYSGPVPYYGAIKTVGVCSDDVDPSVQCLYSAPVDCALYSSERELLNLLYTETSSSEDPWYVIGTWATPNSPACSTNISNGLFGIGCDLDNHVVTINLANNNLKGCIPNIFHCFKYLKFINLSSNFEGTTQTIPDSICQNEHLQYLTLDNDELISPIPQCLGDLKNVMDISIANNLFTGCIDDELDWVKNATNLRTLNVNCNSFTSSDESETLSSLKLQALLINGNDVDCTNTNEYNYYLECGASSTCPKRTISTEIPKTYELENCGTYYLDKQ